MFSTDWRGTHGGAVRLFYDAALVSRHPGSLSPASQKLKVGMRACFKTEVAMSLV